MNGMNLKSNKSGGIVMEERAMHTRLRELRKESKITQEQLAQFLGVDQSMITKLENGTRSLQSTMVDSICSLFGCTEEYLLGESDAYIPLNFDFCANGIREEDLKGIIAVNRIAANLRYMNALKEFAF